MWSTKVGILVLLAATVLAEETNESNPVTPASVSLPTECGKMAAGVTTEMENSGTITNATGGQFPWIAMLGYKTEGKIQYQCIGTLISNRFVITTIQCAVDVNNFGVPVIARLGDYTTETSTHRQDIHVDRISINANFRRNFKHNIAILRLKEEAKINDYVSPICLPIGSMASKEMEEQTIYVVERQEEKRQYPYYRTNYNTNYRYDSYGNRVYYAVTSTTEEPDNSTTDSTVSTTTSGPCKSCGRRRNKMWIDYRADMVLDKSECVAKLAEGIECSECQYSTEGTLCTGGDIKNYDRCNRQISSPVIYTEDRAADKSKFYLVGLIVKISNYYCQDPALALSTKISEHMDWILDNMKI